LVKRAIVPPLELPLLRQVEKIDGLAITDRLFIHTILYPFYESFKYYYGQKKYSTNIMLLGILNNQSSLFKAIMQRIQNERDLIDAPWAGCEVSLERIFRQPVGSG
jgi:hypothetical protein